MWLYQDAEKLVAVTVLVPLLQRDFPLLVQMHPELALTLLKAAKKN